MYISLTFAVALDYQKHMNFELQTGDFLLERFNAFFPAFYKPQLYKRIIQAPAGRLNLERYVFPMFDEAHRLIEKHIFEVNYQTEKTTCVGVQDFLIDLFTFADICNLDEVMNRLVPIFFTWSKQNIPHGYFNLFLKEVAQLDRFANKVCEHLKKDANDSELELYKDLMRLTEDACSNAFINKRGAYNLTDHEKEIYAKFCKEVEESTYNRIEFLKYYIRAYNEKFIKDGIKQKFTRRKTEDMFSVLLRMERCKSIAKEFLYVHALATYETCKKELSNKVFALFHIKTWSRLFVIKTKMRLFKGFADFDQNISKIKPTYDSDTIVLMLNDYSSPTAMHLLPLMLELRRQGHVVIPTNPYIMKSISSKYPDLDDISGSYNGGIDIRKEYKSKRKRKLKWDIDLPNRKIICCKGYNVYQSIFEFAARYQFGYFLRYDTDGWARFRVEYLIDAYDFWFEHCEEVQDWAKKHQKNLRIFIGGSIHLHFGGAFRIFCETEGYKNNMELISVNLGYDSYFKLGDAKAETITALNLTRNVNSRTSIFGTKEGFEAFYTENVQKLPEYRNEVREWLTLSRGSLSSDYEQSEKDLVLAKIRSFKENCKKVFLLNGKIVFDLGVKYTAGVVHSDMSDWITHTVRVFNDKSDHLLVIKPHPYEHRFDLTLTSDEVSLRSIIMENMNTDNIIYLDSRAFNIHELIGYVDCGLLWNGTSLLEFTAQKLPTLLCDDCAYFDFPIGVPRISAIEEYENYLINGDVPEVTDELADKATMFLKYFSSDSVRMYNPYTSSSLLNTNQLTYLSVNEEAVDRYIVNGDKVLEKFVKSLM